jgi:beta-phosphoglucomutase-like phosphatase (HAD superfamily)
VSAWQETARDPALVASALERVFERAELRPSEESAVERAIEEVLEGLGRSAAPEFAGWVLLIAAAVALGFLAAWILKQLRVVPGERRAARRVRAHAEAPGPVAPIDRVVELRRLARQAREQGELALALRLAFAALLLGLGRAGGLEYRAAWTARELLARGRPEPDVARALEPMVEHVDARTFGRTPVSAADLDQVEELSARWLERRGGSA